jgi:hypothetical protein
VYKSSIYIVQIKSTLFIFTIVADASIALTVVPKHHLGVEAQVGFILSSKKIRISKKASRIVPSHQSSHYVSIIGFRYIEEPRMY